jgi:aminoglycoside phosphotransferase
LERMPHGYTNMTTTDGSAVIKSYQGPGAALRCAREAAVLTALAGRLPVPPVLHHDRTCLRLCLLPGQHGQELLDRGLAEPVLRACGLMLRRIQAMDPGVVPALPASLGRPVLVHGDYGPQNILLDRAAREVTGIVDWEWSHAGGPVEDLAWCEWIIRMHHPGHVGALSAFFSAYGGRPPWGARHQAMIGQARAILAFAEQQQPGGPAAHLWEQRVRITESWG